MKRSFVPSEEKQDPLNLEDWVTALSFKRLCFEEPILKQSDSAKQSEVEPTAEVPRKEVEPRSEARPKAHKRKAIHRCLEELVTYHAVLLQSVQKTDALIRQLDPEVALTQVSELNFLLSLDNERTMLDGTRDLIERKAMRLFQVVNYAPSDYHG